LVLRRVHYSFYRSRNTSSRLPHRQSAKVSHLHRAKLFVLPLRISFQDCAPRRKRLCNTPLKKKQSAKGGTTVGVFGQYCPSTRGRKHRNGHCGPETRGQRRKFQRSRRGADEVWFEVARALRQNFAMA